MSSVICTYNMRSGISIHFWLVIYRLGPIYTDHSGVSVLYLSGMAKNLTSLLAVFTRFPGRTAVRTARVMGASHICTFVHDSIQGYVSVISGP